MPQGNVEIVRSLYRAMDARDLVAVAELTDPDSELRRRLPVAIG